ncbi:NADH dehydrogenase [ubiquinone] 1 alpha subcomplex assembly factor 4 [Anolis carolinensis]|uniref:NADH dehydrogenase [ubiquinone] 1 alpha subcomplex assembly factor 4 n=1 Tax=Anolis carolinensis TaxID=28377 RepID=UPI002F2B659D
MMGARVTRVFRHFNLESRAHREIGKTKPAPAPRHPLPAATEQQPSSIEFQEEIMKKDEHLVTLLKDVYVDSRDPPKQVNKGRSLKTEERSVTNIGNLSQLDVQTVPKGKISIVEVLTILTNHHRSPQTWTAEKISIEYSLELKDVTALLTFFMPFAVEIFPDKNKKNSGT